MSFSVWFSSLNIKFSSSVHVVARFSSFLYLSNIPLCIYVFPWFLHSSTDGHLVSFYVLTIINNVAMSLEVQITFQVSVLFPLDKYLKVEFLDHMLVIFLIF